MEAVKIVAVSDLHGNLPVIPPCDLLLIAGDICPDFVARAPQRAWFVNKFLPWAKAQPATDVFATWGNHDWLPRPAAAWADLVEARDLVKIDELVELPCALGVLKIWFTPWSNEFGAWAWMASEEDLAVTYARIPDGVDIIVSHQPAYGYGDVPDPRYYIGESPRNVGSKELLAAIGRVRPKLVFCGHIHGGYGEYEAIGGVKIYNCSLVDEGYRPVNPVTIVEVN